MEDRLSKLYEVVKSWGESVMGTGNRMLDAKNVSVAQTEAHHLIKETAFMLKHVDKHYRPEGGK